MDPNSLIARIGGHPAGRDLQQEFQHEVARLLGRNNYRSFPGAQPVSFSLRHIDELKKQDYFVCEKTDGMRYLLYLTHDGNGNDCHYLIDRKNDYYYVRGPRFPHHENNPTFANFHTETVLDGELVEDRMPDGTSRIKFLVFDLLVIDGKDLRERTLDKRLGYFKQQILKPYRELVKKKPEMSGPFEVEDKQTEFSYALPKMFHEIIPRVKQLHGNDGLIFTCKNTKYVSGTDQHILKWKPPNENTVDFLLNIVWDKMEPDVRDPDQSPQEDFHAHPLRFELGTYLGNDIDYEVVDELYVSPDEWEELKSLGKRLQHAIVECFLEDTTTDASTSADTVMNGVTPTDSINNGHGSRSEGGGFEGKRWRFHRFRDDKTDANHISTYNSVIESIRDHVTEDDLLKHADDIRNAWKTRMTRDQRQQSGRM